MCAPHLAEPGERSSCPRIHGKVQAVRVCVSVFVCVRVFVCVCVCVVTSLSQV